MVDAIHSHMARVVEGTEVGPADTLEDINSRKFWDPYQDPSTLCLKTYLRSLQIGQHYCMGKCMVATDGSLRLLREKEEGETMGAGVA